MVILTEKAVNHLCRMDIDLNLATSKIMNTMKAIYSIKIEDGDYSLILERFNFEIC